MKKFFAIALVAVCAMLSSACSKDNVYESKLVGTWEFVSVEGTVTSAGVTITLNSDIAKKYIAIAGAQMTFNEDGTCSDGATYAVEDENLVIKTSDKEVMKMKIVSIDNKTLVLGMNESYTEGAIEVVVDAKLNYNKVK